MELGDNKRKRNLGVSQARVGKYHTLKRLRQDFSQANDPDSTNKSFDDQSILSNSCGFSDDKQNAISDIIKLEPDMNLDFLSEEDAASAFSSHENCYDNTLTQKRCASISKEMHPPEYDQIRNWAINNEISDCTLQDLLTILRKRLLPELPNSAREFLEINVLQEKKQEEESQSITMSCHEFQAIMAKLSSMQADIREIANNQRHLDDLVRNSNFSGSKQAEQSFADKYDLELPLKDLEKLFAFEAVVAQDPQCKKDFMASLNFLLEEKLSKSALGIIKKFIHRDVALKCTAVKQMEGKFVMRLDVPTIWHCIVDMLMTYHKTNEKEVHSSIGTVLTNAKDWDGYRAQRDKTKDNGGKQNSGWST